LADPVIQAGVGAAKIHVDLAGVSGILVCANTNEFVISVEAGAIVQARVRDAIVKAGLAKGSIESRGTLASEAQFSVHAGGSVHAGLGEAFVDVFAVGSVGRGGARAGVAGNVVGAASPV